MVTFCLIKKIIMVENIIYRLTEIIQGRKITSKVKELTDFYKKNYKEREGYSNKKIYDLILYCKNNIPYYSDLFKKINFNVENVLVDKKFLCDLPPLDKNIIREQYDRLFTKDYKQKKFFISKTGGSTGPSCHIYYDSNARDYSSAVTNYVRQRIGISRTNKTLNISSLSNENEVKNILIKDNFFTREYFKSLILNRTNIYLENYNDQSLKKLYSYFKNSDCDLIHCHPSILFFFSNFLNSNNLTLDFHKKIFEPSGEMLFKYMEESIKNTLNCKIHNRYGLAEFGIVGYDFGFGEDNNRIDILDSEVYPEEINGELVLTGLRNTFMPLLRYRTGDLAKLCKDKNGLYIKNLSGRTHDMFSIGNKVYSTINIMDILDHKVKGVKEFQIDISGYKNILKIVPESNIDITIHKKKIRHFLGDDFIINYVKSSDLKVIGIRNKFRHVIT